MSTGITHRTRSGIQITYEPISPERLAERLAFTQLTPADVKLVASFERVFIPRIPAMVDAFYAHLWTIPELRAVVQKYSSIEQLKLTLSEYLRWFMRGEIDQAYVDYRYRVGAVHEKIGLAPQWYLGMFHIFETHIYNMIHDSDSAPDQCGLALIAFMKMLSLDMQLAMDAYIQAYVVQRTSQLERLRELRQSLAESSQDLAASSEELSASSEQMVASVGSVLHDTTEMQHEAEDIRKTAEAGATRIQQVADTIRQVAQQMESMQGKVAELADSSRQMETILKTVDAIAKQTNLLSLNAAIEAARAGQYGRGFAVVADEVRKLSDRTSASLREISKLIANSNSHVSSVQASTQEAGSVAQQGMTEAVTAEKEFGQIAQLVGGAAERIRTISSAMEELSEMSGHVKQGAEQNANLATTLSDLAHRAE